MKAKLIQALAILLAGFSGSASHAQPAPVREPMPPRTPGEFIPLVKDDRRVTFKLKAPGAREVTLKGVGPDTSLARDDGETWSVTLGPLGPKIYEYYFMVDGAHMADPKNPQVAVNANVNGPCLGSVFKVPGGEPQWHDLRTVPRDAVHIRWYDSKTRKNPQRLHIYVPPGYDAGGSARYPVLYLFHGGGFDDSSWSGAGRAQVILDNLIAAGEAVPMLIVMPSGGIPDEFGRNLATMPAEIRDSIIPFVEASYRVMGDADHRAVIGFSMSGAQSLMVGLGGMDLFHWVGGMGSAIHTASDDAVIAPIFADAAGANRTLRLLWLGVGGRGLFVTDQPRFCGAPHGRRGEACLAHPPWRPNWNSWRPYLKEFAAAVFK